MAIPTDTLISNDPYLESHRGAIEGRYHYAEQVKANLLQNHGSLSEFAMGHHFFGLHRTEEGWVIREWAPNATCIFLLHNGNHWQRSDEDQFYPIGHGNWELKLSRERIRHGDLYKLLMCWDGGEGERLPAWCNRAVQDDNNKSFTAQVWSPEVGYTWKHPFGIAADEPPLVYESHVGMAQEEGKVGTYIEYRDKVLPRIAKAGYNTIQLMAIQEHPYYGSFGYHVSNLFAPSSRFGTPEELKSLIDEAHGMGIRVIMDIVHSHAVKNEAEGISRFDGTPYQFFHDGPRGDHEAWDSRCFNYGRHEVLHFLLSNCRYWLEEFRFDGYRFDGVTSMIYLDHGLGMGFTSYEHYYNGNQDSDALTYLKLANEVIHEVKPSAITIAEEMSGIPGLAVHADLGGYGFDYRLAMGTPDFWIKIIKEKSDADWNMDEIYHELTNKRRDEKVVSYVESHDQALVGDKTVVFRLIDAEMYTSMSKHFRNMIVDRGMALHKMIRLITLSTAGHSYLNFMGNEFGHPEWIDFPREGNDWSYHYARRQWSLIDNHELRYHELGDFDRDMIHLLREQRLLDVPDTIQIYSCSDRKVLAFRRRSCVFIYNFNPDTSFDDLEFEVPEGTYRMALNTDDPCFGGFGNVDAAMDYVTTPRSNTGFDPHVLRCYLPSRTAVVLVKK